MSRNLRIRRRPSVRAVAPREGRVSRNMPFMMSAGHVLVAPREGRVSRNGVCSRILEAGGGSRPARGV